MIDNKTLIKIIKEKEDNYYKVSASKLEIELKRDIKITFRQGELSIKDYAIMLGQLKMYINQRKEADKKIDEIYNILREANRPWKQ